jgi:hypothetical protein
MLFLTGFQNLLSIIWDTMISVLFRPKILEKAPMKYAMHFRISVSMPIESGLEDVLSAWPFVTHGHFLRNLLNYLRTTKTWEAEIFITDSTNWVLDSVKNSAHLIKVFNHGWWNNAPWRTDKKWKSSRETYFISCGSLKLKVIEEWC